jgi:hypothetical protein
MREFAVRTGGNPGRTRLDLQLLEATDTLHIVTDQAEGATGGHHGRRVCLATGACLALALAVSADRPTRQPVGDLP